MHIRIPFKDFHIYASWKHIIYVQYRISEFPPAVIYTIVKSMIDSQNETKSLLYKMQFFYKANILVFIRLQRNSPPLSDIKICYWQRLGSNATK